MKFTTCICKYRVTFSLFRSDADEMCCDGIRQVAAVK